MASLRVFVSSTYYDLQHVRNDLYVFLKELGYEPVMHDKGNIPYTQQTTLEESCYNELLTCDVVVCIIGNKYGTGSSQSNYSITMEELRTAFKARKKVYTFIVKDVYIENKLYEINKDKGTIELAYADDIRIHEFISELKSTIKNSPIQPFEAISDITDNLKSQFSGLFQRLLSQEASATESKTYYDLQATSDEIKNLINNFSKQNEEFIRKFDSTIYASNPTLKKISSFLGMKESLFYAPTKTAIIEFLKIIGFNEVEDFSPNASNVELHRETYLYNESIILKEGLFDSDEKIKWIKNPELDQLLLFERKDTDFLPF